MKISIISVFPELHERFIATSLIARAVEKNLISFNLIKLSDMCAPKERIDEPTCGPGAGMIIKPEVIEKAIDTAETAFGLGYRIFFSPQGELLTQPRIRQLATELFDISGDASPDIKTWQTERASSQPVQPITHLILVCSRYEGMDARVEQYYAHKLISIGDYVLMGGDLPAQVFLEAILRLIPGIVGKNASVEHDSFTGPLLDHPEYGLPTAWKDLIIPEVIRSGNHQLINTWRRQEACKNTLYKRFDWFRAHNPSSEDKTLACSNIPSHYIVLMHDQVHLKHEGIGQTSIATLDIHDIARSSATYGIKNYFIVSPMKDQQTILKTFLDFWRSDDGKQYNETRHRAISAVIPAFSLAEVIEHIQKIEKKDPIIISTSAKIADHQVKIDYNSQGKIWSQERPVLFIFGTGQGLSREVLDQSHYMLLPIQGLTDYNHLSVRAATSIILDRWLGLNQRLE